MSQLAQLIRDIESPTGIAPKDTIGTVRRTLGGGLVFSAPAIGVSVAVDDGDFREVPAVTVPPMGVVIRAELVRRFGVE